MPSESGTAGDAVDGATVDDATVDDATVDDATVESDGPARDDESRAVEWGPVRYDRLRSLGTGATVTILGGVAVVFGAMGVALVTDAVRGSGTLPSVDGGTVALGVVVLAAVLVALVPTLYAVYHQSTAGRWSVERLRDGVASLRPGWTVAGAVAAAVPFLVVPADFLTSLWPLFWLVWFVPAVSQSEGGTVRLDPATATVERTYPLYDRTRSDDLGSVVRTRRIDLPWTTVFLLAYRGNAWYRSTPWLFVPNDRADEVESTLDAVLAESDGPDRASVPERLTLAVLGSSSLVVGLLMAVAAGEGAGGLALALLSAPFSFLFLALAARL
ncbi:hypothetical protein EXE46_05295 [Halorubrum sp. GN11_10-6_MGM]|uniref:hypothetical protein n=1 Tax=Halorubrum sp. GN11_10-6_MGM TaxID=2518112 RepID=UPI0010F56A6D|nr:hypothetical protein [Halorubrum sp. GN11_10-6_MGM]TKX75041.1 hypothetical protein EXE46_05295 [Halorubrum sp. GN11_10-6_MGM]